MFSRVTVRGILVILLCLLDPAPMDFSAWLEIFMSGLWWHPDTRPNRPSTGHIAVTHGRDAEDIAISTTFGSAQLAVLKIIAKP
jgi:hypothetical protein